jgi:hypothetical protein
VSGPGWRVMKDLEPPGGRDQTLAGAAGQAGAGAVPGDSPPSPAGSADSDGSPVWSV